MLGGLRAGLWSFWSSIARVVRLMLDNLDPLTSRCGVYRVCGFRGLGFRAESRILESAHTGISYQSLNKNRALGHVIVYGTLRNTFGCFLGV